MTKILTRLGVLAAACCAAAPALAQPHRGGGAAPAPHISAPAPHISAPAAPHVSAAPRISAAPRFNAAPRVSAAPRFHAAPRISPHVAARAPNVHQFAPRGHALAGRNFAHRTIHGAPAPSRHALGRVNGRTAARTSRNLADREARRTTRAAGNLAHGTRGNLARETRHQRPGERTNARTGVAGEAVTNRNRATETNNRNRVAEPGGRNRLTGAQVAALSRPLGERNRNDNDRRVRFEERRRFRPGGFIGWFGPVFWPYAFDDFFDYAFWPSEYDDYGFWPYAYDDVFDNVFFAPGTEDIYASVGGGYANGGGGGRGTARRQGRETSRTAAQLCRTDPGLTQWPTQEIAQVVEPKGDQQRFLDDLKLASQRAAKILQAECPTTPPSTPVGRLDAMANRLDAMLQALDVVRPPLAKFYDSLSDEQKARFNAMGRQQTAGGKGTDEARLCQTQAPAGLTDEAMNRIGQEVRPDDRQKAGLDDLRDAAGKAADILRNACPSQTPITPVARLDAMSNHVKAMLDAINTVRPALAHFYASLSDEQKAHFNVMGREASNQ